MQTVCGLQEGRGPVEPAFAPIERSPSKGTGSRVRTRPSAGVPCASSTGPALRLRPFCRPTGSEPSARRSMSHSRSSRAGSPCRGTSCPTGNGARRAREVRRCGRRQSVSAVDWMRWPEFGSAPETRHAVAHQLWNSSATVPQRCPSTDSIRGRARPPDHRQESTGPRRAERRYTADPDTGPASPCRSRPKRRSAS